MTSVTRERRISAATCSATAEGITCLGDWIIEYYTFYILLGLRGYCGERMLFARLLTYIQNNLSSADARTRGERRTYLRSELHMVLVITGGLLDNPARVGNCRRFEVVCVKSTGSADIHHKKNQNIMGMRSGDVHRIDMYSVDGCEPSLAA